MELGRESSKISGNCYVYVQPISWRRGIGGGRGNEEVWNEGRGERRANLDVFIVPNPICLILLASSTRVIIAPGKIV